MKFRKRFNSLRTEPSLDYRQYRQIGECGNNLQGSTFRFTGVIESITDGRTLWVKGENLTIPVSLEKTQCFLLPPHKDENVPEAPEQIRWNRISTFTEGTKVFIGGVLKVQDNRLTFVSVKEKPLTIIFYNCKDDVLTEKIIRAARTRNEYWNPITPVSIVIGALALLYIATSLITRPAFRMTVIVSFIAIFAPILPLFPPGLLFTFMYRRIVWHARRYRAYLDLVRLPLDFLPSEEKSVVLSNGEKYGYIKLNQSDAAQPIPHLIPELSMDAKQTHLYFFGVLDKTSSLPVKPKDPFASFGILPDSPKRMALHYVIKAYSVELLGWLMLILGIISNIIFTFMLLSQFQVVVF